MSSSEREAWAFWFGDIRGFSTVTARHGEDVACRLVQLFQRLLDETLDALSLVPHLRKVYGDGIMLVFPSAQAQRAVQLATCVQRTIARHNRDLDLDQEGPLLLWVGIGLAQGAVRWLEGEPIGHSVNLAKRLAERARGGQVLLDDELGSSFKDSFPLYLQEDELKGIGRQRFYELRWGGEELARLEVRFSALTLIGPFGRLCGDQELELALILSADRHLRIELGRELTTQLEELPRRLERSFLLRPLGRKLRQLVAQAPAGLGRENPLEHLNISFEPEHRVLSIKLHPSRRIGGSFRLSLTTARYDPEQLARFLSILKALQS